ncbi:MAG: molecular chaperone DnaJ [Thermoguttaceae bacterium]
MAEKRDYYEVLGVDRSATRDQMAEVYRKLAMRYHPDRNPGDEAAVARFKEAAEAFEVLSHPEKRAQYDRYGFAGLGAGAPQFRDVGDIFEAFGDIFGEGLFGDLFGGRRSRRPHKGEDVQCVVTLDLTEAAKGAVKIIQFDRRQACETCGGSGAKPGSRPETCPYCGGSGRVVQRSGFFSVQTGCPSCRGAGQVIREPCSACRGSGLVKHRVSRKVNIPAGVETGNQVRLDGEGEPSANGGPRGDCYCGIQVAEHPLFHREGRDLVCQVPITFSQAALGTTIDVPTLAGPEPLVIPAGTQPGDVFTLRGRGMPDLRRRGRGDLHVQVYVEVPKRVSPRCEELLRELADIENTDVTPKRKSFFEKIKQYFQQGPGDRDLGI